MHTEFNPGAAASRPLYHRLLSRVLDNPVAETLIEQPVMSYYLQDLNSLWSLVDLRARVEQVIDETHDAKTFVLRPNWRWPGFSAGQNVGVNVEIDGVVQRRRYSMSCADSERGRFQITIKRVDGGRVSNWLHDNIRPGNVLNLSAPAGDFVLPSVLPQKMLLLGGGSGITPLMSKIQTLLENGYAGDIVLLYFVRSPNDRIFGQRLDSLETCHANFRVVWCFEDDGAGGKPERFSKKQIAARVPDYRERAAFLCGPPGFMAAVREHWDAQGLANQLAFEYFGAPPVAVTDDGDVDAQVSLAKKARGFTAQAGKTLLEAMEDAGEAPVYGCRMGICHECKCRKTAGSVKNILTGAVTSGEEDIQICVSVAAGEVTLDY